MQALFLILAIAFVLSWIPALVIFRRAHRRFAGSRRVLCPEAGHSALVRLDAAHAAATTLTGEPELQIEACNRWAGPVGHCSEGCVGGDTEPPRSWTTHGLPGSDARTRM